MKILTEAVALDELKEMATVFCGSLVKAVVDVERKLMAVDAELHSDLEGMLLEDGSKQKDIWGINLHPDKQGDEFVEFDSIINMRPSQKNRSRGVEDEETRGQIVEVVKRWVRK